MGTNGGISCLSAGDTLDIRAGTYTENLQFGTSRSGTSWTNAITIRGHVGETVQINGPLAFNTGTIFRYWIIDNLIFNGSTIFTGLQTDHIRISNSEIKNANCIGLQGGGSFHEFINVSVHNSGQTYQSCGGYGVYWWGNNTLFERMHVYDNPGYGFHIYYSGWTTVSNNIVRYSFIHNNGGYASSTHGGDGTTSQAGLLMANGTGNQAYGNVVYGNQNGIVVNSTCLNCLVYNNTVYANNKLNGLGQLATANGIVVGGTGAVVKNNIVVGEAENGIRNTGTGNTISNNHCDSAGTGCITTGNPLFVDPVARNFSLNIGSPAIDRGIPLSDVPAFDIVGTPRPKGLGWDIGSYESR